MKTAIASYLEIYRSYSEDGFICLLSWILKTKTTTGTIEFLL